MRLAIIGHGAMGKLVESLARDQGHEVALTITSRDAARSAPAMAATLDGIDVAIDFSVAGAVLKHMEACARAGVALVEGTTGWREHEPAARAIVHEKKGALVYGANFSVGVNIYYRVVEHASRLFEAAGGYAPFIEEAHHIRKRDAPSGTALRLRDIVSRHFSDDISVASTRAGYIPGTHTVGFDGLADQVLLRHIARTREGFAAGALTAARWIKGKSGVYEFSEVMDQILADGQ